MTTDELQGIISASGLQSRAKGNEVIIATCTFCGNTKWNLELNVEKGVYHAWCCNAGGRLDALLKQITGQSYRVTVTRQERSRAAPLPDLQEFLTKAITEVPSAAHYLLTRRGITPDTAAIYGIRVCVQEGHQLMGRIVVPAQDFWSRATLGWMGRTYTGGIPKYLSTLTAKAVTGWRQRDRNTPIVIVEGAFDGIAVHRAGFQAAVLGGTNVPNILEFAARVSQEAAMYIMLDSDTVEAYRPTGLLAEFTAGMSISAGASVRLFWQLRQVCEDVRWIPMPDGIDPADLTPEQIQKLIRAVVATT